MKSSYTAFTVINAMAISIYAGHLIRWLVLRHYARRATANLARVPAQRSWLTIIAATVIVFAAASLAYAAVASADCPPEGDGGDPALNAAKNRLDHPATPVAMDVAQILALRMTSTRLPRARWTGAQRAVVADADGRGVVVAGYLIGAKEEGPESANCHGAEHSEHDFHMYLVASPSDPKAKAVVIEITPRQHSTGWTLSAMQRIVRQRVEVRVTGWLLYDQEHGPDVGKSRGTLWEIHPVTGIEVMQGSKWVQVGGGS